MLCCLLFSIFNDIQGFMTFFAPLFVFSKGGRRGEWHQGHKWAATQRSARAPFSRPRSSSRLLACPSPRSRRDRGEDFFLIPRSFRGKNEEFLGFLTFFETDTKDETRIKLSPRSRQRPRRGIFAHSSVISRSM